MKEDDIERSSPADDSELEPRLSEGLKSLWVMAGGEPHAPVELKALVLRKTARMVVRRRMARRSAIVLGAAACILLGIWIGRMESRSTSTETPSALPSPLPAPSGSFELPARGSPHDAASRLRLAGDEILHAGGNLERALDCYRQSLELESAKAGVEAPDGGSWLYQILKEGQLLASRERNR